MNHEYIVYFNDKTPLVGPVAHAVYELLTTLPYPLNRSPLNADAVAQLTQDERYLLYTNEPALILAKIREINPNLNVILFPKSLQQFYIYCATQNAVLSPAHAKLIKFFTWLGGEKIKQKHAEIEDFSNNCIAATKDEKFCRELSQSQLECIHKIPLQAISTIGEDTNTWQKFFSFEVAKNYNSKNEMQGTWIALNAALTAEYHASGNYRNSKQKLLTFADNWIDKVINELPRMLRDATHCNENPNDVLEPYCFMYRPSNLHLLKTLLNFETNLLFTPAANNLYAIYRGSKFGSNSDKALMNNEPKHTLSYSNGFLEGSVSDAGANSWQYMQVDPLDPADLNTGYALLFDPNQDDNAIFVPPLVNAARVFGRGESFHVRTKSKCNGKTQQLIKTKNVTLSDPHGIRGKKVDLSAEFLSDYLATGNECLAPVDELVAETVNMSTIKRPLLFSLEMQRTTCYPETNLLSNFLLLLALCFGSKILSDICCGPQNRTVRPR